MSGEVAARGAEAGFPRSRGRPSEGAREALVGAARELFTEHDFHAVGTAQVLARAGVSRGAMYHHFPSKTDLFRAAWETSERDLLARFTERSTGGGSPFESLVSGCRAYLVECATSRELQRIGLRQSRAVLGWEQWSEAVAALGLGVMKAGVGAAVESGELRTNDVDATARILLSALIEAGLLIATARDPRARLREIEPEAMRFVLGLGVAAVDSAGGGDG
ncbi:MAG TPA: TetR/AcrR family transcriptional regulator [Thermoleophilaceae bacterium]|jgi:AcrR family transcriptional regulator